MARKLTIWYRILSDVLTSVACMTNQTICNTTTFLIDYAGQQQRRVNHRPRSQRVSNVESVSILWRHHGFSVDFVATIIRFSRLVPCNDCTIRLSGTLENSPPTTTTGICNKQWQVSITASYLMRGLPQGTGIPKCLHWSSIKVATGKLSLFINNVRFLCIWSKMTVISLTCSNH